MNDLFEYLHCKNCGMKLIDLLDSVPQREIWEEMRAHANKKCSTIDRVVNHE